MVRDCGLTTAYLSVAYGVEAGVGASWAQSGIGAFKATVVVFSQREAGRGQLEIGVFI